MLICSTNIWQQFPMSIERKPGCVVSIKFYVFGSDNRRCSAYNHPLSVFKQVGMATNCYCYWQPGLVGGFNPFEKY